MKDNSKTKKQLIHELWELRQQTAELEKSEIGRKQAEARRSGEQYRNILDNSLIGTYSTNFEGDIFYVNKALLRMLEFDSLEEIKSVSTLTTYRNPDDREVLIRTLKEKGSISNFEVELLTKTGQSKDVVINAILDGEVISGMIMDITEQKRMRDELKDKEEYFRSLIENSSDIIVILNPDGIVKYLSPSVERTLGYKPDELIDKNAFEFIHRDDMPETMSALTLAIRNPDKTHSAEFRFLHKDGSWCFLEAKGKSILKDSGHIVINCRDITERRQVQDALQKSEKLYRLIAENTNDMITRHLPDSTYLYVSPACRTLFGYEPEELIGTKAFDQIHPEDVKRVISITQKAIRTGGSNMGQYRHLKKDGQYIWVETVGKVIKNEVTGEIEDIICVVRDITERKRAEEALRQGEEHYRKQFEEAIDAIFLADVGTGMIVDCNIAATKLVEREKSEIIGKHQSFMHPAEDIKDGFSKTFKSHMTGESSELLEDRVITKSGQIKDVAIRASKITIEGKEVIQGIFRDITERKRAENALEKLHRHNELILKSAAEGIIGLDSQGNHTFVNPSAARMLGYEVEELIGKHSHTIWHHSMDNGSTYPEDNCPIYTTLKDGAIHHNIRDEVFWRKDGTGFSVAYSSTPIMDEGKLIGVVVNFRDITERKLMGEKLEHLAYYDAWTDLPNRNLFLDRVNQAIARAEPKSRIVAVLITNINKFKSINDTYGSEIGDRVLKEIAKRLSTSVRKGDTIARLSNDEFGIALLDVAHPDDIIMVLEKIIKDISYPLKVNGDELTLTFSSGVSLYPNDGDSASQLLKAAGLALGIVKKDRMKPYQFFTEDLNVKASEFISMEKGLLKAIANKELILHYQPYWDITTKKMVGMEALIRWQSPTNGLVPPGKFIPVLEDTGMIIEVGEWILRTAIGQIKEWQNNGYPIVPVAVNLSLIQFRQKELAETVNKIIRESGFYPSLLTLEITESAFMQNIEFTNSVLGKLKDIGVSISIDDFGTGYSSLSYLRRFPIDNLKIDISFISEITTDPDTASIVTAIINMAHTLNVKTIAEGIETEEQWKILRLLRCDMGQGFYLSKPLPAKEVEEMLI